MIARQEVADLNAGDIVEITDERWPGSVVRGPLTVQNYTYCPGALCLRDIPVRSAEGQPYGAPTASLTVIERAPEPPPRNGVAELDAALIELADRLRLLLNGQTR